MKNKNIEEPKLTDQEMLLTDTQVCQLLRISRTGLWRFRQAGKIGFYRVGHKILYSNRHVAEFLAKQEKRAA